MNVLAAPSLSHLFFRPLSHLELSPLHMLHSRVIKDLQFIHLCLLLSLIGGAVHQFDFRYPPPAWSASLRVFRFQMEESDKFAFFP